MFGQLRQPNGRVASPIGSALNKYLFACWDRDRQPVGPDDQAKLHSQKVFARVDFNRHRISARKFPDDCAVQLKTEGLKCEPRLTSESVNADKCRLAHSPPVVSLDTHGTGDRWCMKKCRTW